MPGASAAMTRKDKVAVRLTYGIHHRGRHRLFWLGASLAFLGGVLLQLL